MKQPQGMQDPNFAIHRKKEIDYIVKGQEQIQKEIYDTAILHNLANESIEPIYDGVCDVEGYVNSPFRIMWILKEPYDDFDEEGNPIGGGFCIYDGLVKKNPEDIKITITQKNMIYVTNGILSRTNYDDMGNYRAYIERLKQIVFINISKMPAYSNSGSLTQKFEIWKDIVKKQIEIYQPQLIICGNTFNYLREFPLFEESRLISSSDKYQGQVDLYENGEVFIMDAYHPGRKGQIYIDALINCACDNM